MIKALLIKIIVALLAVGTVATATVVTVIKIKEAKQEAASLANNGQNEAYEPYSGETIEVGYPTEIEEGHVHTLINTPGVKASCTENGLTEGKKCANCGQIIVAQSTIPAIGHVYKDGFCVNCGEKEPECEHENTEIIKGYSPICTASGLTDGIQCADCGQILAVQNVIPSLGHKYQNHVCERCGHHEHDDCDPSNIEVTLGYEATCQHTGLTTGIVCLECGEIIATQDIIDRMDHDYLHGICTSCGSKENANCEHANTTVIMGFSATCSQSGLTDGTRCMNCGAVIKKQSIIKALGHNYVNGYCTRCGASDPSVSGENETEKIKLDESLQEIETNEQN